MTTPESIGQVLHIPDDEEYSLSSIEQIYEHQDENDSLEQFERSLIDDSRPYYLAVNAKAQKLFDQGRSRRKSLFDPTREAKWSQSSNGVIRDYDVDFFKTDKHGFVSKKVGVRLQPSRGDEKIEHTQRDSNFLVSFGLADDHVESASLTWQYRTQASELPELLIQKPELVTPELLGFMKEFCLPSGGPDDSIGVPSWDFAYKKARVSISMKDFPIISLKLGTVSLVFTYNLHARQLERPISGQQLFWLDDYGVSKRTEMPIQEFQAIFRGMLQLINAQAIGTFD